MKKNFKIPREYSINRGSPAIRRNLDSFAGQRGAGKLTILVFGIIVFVLVFCAYRIFPFYYYFYELQNQFESHAKAAQIYTDKQLREKLMYHITRMEIPIKGPDDLKINRSDTDMTISMKYREVFYVTWDGKDYDLYSFEFYPKASAPLK